MPVGARPLNALSAGDYLGVDVGGTKVALRLESGHQGVAEVTFRWQAGHSPAQDLDRLAGYVRRLRSDLGGAFTAVGVAMPATVDATERVTAWPNRPTWTGLGLGSALRGIFPDTPVGWADDGDLAALVEGRAAGRDLLYLGVGTGIGGGVLLGGELCPGPGRGSFEIGHLVVALNGPACRCGRSGCLQALASGPATLARAARLRAAPVPLEEFGAAAIGGRAWAGRALRESARALAAAAIGVEELLHPGLVVIGGGFASAVPGLVELVGESVAGLARPGQPPLPVRAAVLDPGLSSLHGAVALARLIVAEGSAAG